ncbi:MAG: DUF2975 domain-containing protein [Propionibacteriaceae bacterium]|nr:DUF2975 domain-containing protein [Propionibacteriaceae bacterium]
MSVSTPQSRFATRGDFIAARVVLVIATLLLVVGSAAKLWPSGPLHFTSSVEEQGPVYAAPGLLPGASARFSSEIEWTLADPTLGQRALIGLPTALLLVAGLIAAWCLWRLIGAALTGEPFTRRTLWHARALALSVAFVAAFWPFLGPLVNFMLITQVQSLPSVVFTIRLQDFLPIVVAALLVVLTEVYARGLALREDVEGLV